MDCTFTYVLLFNHLYSIPKRFTKGLSFTHSHACVEEVHWCVNEPQHRRPQFKTIFDLWHLKMLWNRSHSQAQLMMGTHLIFHRASICAELFSTHSTRQPSPSGTSSEDYYSELAGNPQRVWLLTILWMCENRMNSVKRKTWKGGGEGQEWDIPREWGTFNHLNLRVAV